MINGIQERSIFTLGFSIVLQGQEIKWTNQDNRSHRLVSGNPDTLVSDGVFDMEKFIGKTGSIVFNTSNRTTSISYFCSLHPNERRTVVVLQREEDLHNDENGYNFLNPHLFLTTHQN